MIIRFDNVRATVFAETRKDKLVYTAVRRGLKVKAPGAEYMPTYRLYKRTKGKAGWDGLVNIMEPQGGFPTGLIPEILMRFEKKGVIVTLEDQRKIKKPTTPKKTKTIELREYQRIAKVEGLSNTLRGTPWPRGVFKLPTGGGKTELAVSIYEENPVNTLFLVHRKTLGYQTVERFEKYGYNPGKIFDGKAEFNPKLNVATIQSLMRNINDSDVVSLLENVEQVFFDEAHLIAAKLAKGNWFSTISTMMGGAYFRWGLTATPFMKDVYSNRLLEGSTGNVLYSIKSKELVDLGYLTPVKVTMIEVPPIYKCSRKWPDCYDEGVVLNRMRHKLLVAEAKKLDKPCFVLTSQVAHAQILHSELQKSGITSEVLTGPDSQEKRARTLKKLQTGKLEIVVCTTIFDEGLDFVDLKSLILAGGGKSQIKAIQRVGRGMRLADDKNVLTVIDFTDTSTPILKKHSEERKSVYEDQGFTVKCV